VEQQTPIASMPADYYRKQAERVRRLADDATTPNVKEHLRGILLEYERLAEKAENAARRFAEATAAIGT